MQKGRAIAQAALAQGDLAGLSEGFRGGIRKLSWKTWGFDSLPESFPEFA